jgi:threonine synthase
MKWQYADEFRTINNKLELYGYPSPVQLTRINDLAISFKYDGGLQLMCSKQRSLSYMIAKYIEMGKTNFVVSSSGNAALVSCYVALRYKEIKLKVFLSKQISDEKITKFITLLHMDATVANFRKGGRYGNIEFDLSDNPKQKAFKLGNEGWVNLRGSQDDLALVGFRSIAYELVEMSDQWDAVFVPASSGTTALGIYQGFREAGLNPAMHIVQTTKVNALVKRVALDRGAAETEHPSESIVDIVGHRRTQVEEMITASNGGGWIISKDEVEEAQHDLFVAGILASYDSALTYAAFKKASKIKRFNNPVMVFTG